jgi:phenylacetate-coenzyme A ligase PaaK-like adenylate-forming protein
MHVEIPKAAHLEQKVFDTTNEKEFNSIALEVYHFQFTNNPVYQDFCNAVRRPPENVRRVSEIPFLPISFFKTHRVETTAFHPQLIFQSSGTTGKNTSTHYVKRADIYERSFLTAFNQFYGPIENQCILGLLPSYLERDGSSLVYMVDHLIKRSGHPDSGFYLHDFEKLNHTLHRLETTGTKTLLIGVTYALLDFAQAFPQHLKHTTIMETGGMKGRQREMTKGELYEELKDSLGVASVHSEYGMTELLSQAYAVDGKFSSPNWMKILLRDETDPFNIYPNMSSKGSLASVSGAINVIDLANLYSCSFIATDDAGRYTDTEDFEVLGRLDNSDIRGCSLLLL